MINLISIYSEGNFLQAVKRFYPLALMGMIGSAIGTQILIYNSTDFFKLLLALSIFLYLFIQKFKIHIYWIEKKKRLATVVFGLIAGLIGGLTNVMASILIIYSLFNNKSIYNSKRLSARSSVCPLAALNKKRDFLGCFER